MSIRSRVQPSSLLWRSVTTMAEPTEAQAAVPVLVTKLRRPSTPLLLIARPRLLDQLTAYGDRRLILVSAPAGYGKTALVSHWLEVSRRRLRLALAGRAGQRPGHLPALPGGGHSQRLP